MDRGSISIYPEYELTKNYSLREKLLSKTLDRQTNKQTNKQTYAIKYCESHRIHSSGILPTLKWRQWRR